MGRQRTTQRPTHFAILFVKQAMVLLLVVGAAITALITTTAGLNVCIWLAKPILPFSVSLKSVRGSILSGMTAEQASISNLITLEKIQVKWFYQTTFQINLSAKSARVNHSEVERILHLPELTEELVDRMMQLDQVRLVVKPYEQSAFLDVNYLSTNYRVTLLNTQRSLTILGGDSMNALTVDYSLTENSGLYLSADGQLMLPNQTTIKFSPSQLNYRDGRLDASINAHSKADQRQLALSIISRAQQEHYVAAKVSDPHGQLSINGQVGKNSDLELKARISSGTFGHIHFDRLQVHSTLKDHLDNPAIGLSIRADQLQLTDFVGNGIALDYHRQSNLNSWLDGSIQLNVGQLSVQNQLAIEQISLGNKQSTSPRDFTLQARQEQVPVSGQIKVQPYDNRVDVVISELTSNHTSLFAPDVQQTVSIYDDRMVLSHEGQSGNIAASGMLYRNGRYAIDVRLHEFLIDSLPRGLISYWNPAIEYLTGKISADLSISGISYSSMPSVYGSFTASLTESYISSLLDGLPINTGLHIRQADVTGAFRPDLSMNANIQTAQGNIAITGVSQNSYRKFSGSIESESLLFLDENGAYVESAFNIKPVIDEKGLDITGQMNVKKADYRLGIYTPPLGLPAETSIQTGSTQSKQLPYRFKIDCHMGDKTNVHVFGFHGILTGNLTVMGSDRTPTTANGELQLNDGTLVIYRQTLPVKKLVLSWLDTPIQSPEINLLIMARGLRNIDGRDQMQEYGVRVYGPIDKLVFDYRASPAPMNSFQIITALLTDASYTKRSNKESIDPMLNAYASSQSSGQMKELLDILSALKSNPLLDNVDISEISFDENNNYVPEISGVTLSKRLDKTFALRYRVTPYDSRFNRLSIDTYLNDRLILTSFIQNEGDIGVSLNYFRTEQ